MLRYLALVSFLWLVPHSGVLLASGIRVLAPVEDADSTAIASIVEGMRRIDKNLEVEFTDNPEQAIRSQGKRPSSIILLGSSLLEKTGIEQPNTTLIGGGYYGRLLPKPDFSSFSLDPSLSIVVEEVRKTGFRLKRLLTVVASDERKDLADNETAGLIDDDIQVVISRSNGVQSTARAWFDLIATLDPDTDVLWVMDSQYLEASGSYKHLIESAWKKRIFVVSTLPNYAARGVSLGFVPDLPNYGEFLLREARYNTGADRADRRTTTPYLRRVYNQRTLEHIGYQLPDDIDRLGLDDIVIQ